MGITYNFEWDHKKAADNLAKHSVAFDESATIFKDSKAISIFDPDHSGTEDRLITMGISEKGRLLVVIHTFQENNKEVFTVRIISSRKATKKEIEKYGELT